MLKTVVKLYKDPGAAQKALKALQASGFSDNEVGMLMRSNGQGAPKGATKVALPKVGDGIASGYLAAALTLSPAQGARAKEEDLDKALAGALGVSADALDYYKLGVSVGSVLVSVQADEAKLVGAKKVLREADSLLQSPKPLATTPGFSLASRMAATNPIDAPMSGDFRRY